MNITNKINTLLSSLTKEEKDDVFKILLMEHVKKDIESNFKAQFPTGKDTREYFVSKIAQKFVYEDKYDHDISYLDNLSKHLKFLNRNYRHETFDFIRKINGGTDSDEITITWDSDGSLPLIALSTQKIHADNVSVYYNGEKKTEFGESFSGYKYDENDVLKHAILAYLNNDKSFTWGHIPVDLWALSGEEIFKPVIEIHDRPIHTYFINSNLEKLKIVLATDRSLEGDNSKYKGWVAYVSDTSDSCCLVEADTGEVITDIENFFMSGVERMLKENIVYKDDDFVNKFKEFVE